MANNQNLRRGGGRPAGAKNKTHTEVRELITNLFKNNIEQMEADFLELKPNERIQALLKMATFVIPTLKSIDVTEDNSGNINPIVIDFAKWK
jgi:hypothetical protein